MSFCHSQCNYSRSFFILKHEIHIGPSPHTRNIMTSKYSYLTIGCSLNPLNVRKHTVYANLCIHKGKSRPGKSFVWKIQRPEIVLSKTFNFAL